MNDILKGIPDKRQDKDTTSLKFKEDLIEFFGEKWSVIYCGSWIMEREFMDIY